MATIAENLQVIKDSLYNIKTTIENHGGVVGDISTYAEALEEILSRYEDGSTPDPSTETTTPAP